MYKSYDISEYILIHLASWLLALTMALAVSVAFVSRPGGQGRFRQAGALAILMVALTWAFNLIQVSFQAFVFRLTTGKTFDDPLFWWVFGPIREVPPRAGLAILAAWATLAVLGGRSPARDWLDRSGRVIGWMWIFCGLFVWSFEFLKVFISNNNSTLKF